MYHCKCFYFKNCKEFISHMIKIPINFDISLAVVSKKKNITTDDEQLKHLAENIKSKILKNRLQENKKYTFTIYKDDTDVLRKYLDETHILHKLPLYNEDYSIIGKLYNNMLVEIIISVIICDFRKKKHH